MTGPGRGLHNGSIVGPGAGKGRGLCHIQSIIHRGDARRRFRKRDHSCPLFFARYRAVKRHDEVGIGRELNRLGKTRIRENHRHPGVNHLPCWRSLNGGCGR